MKKAILYKKLDNNNVKCTACNHYCNIAPNKTGICGVRKNIKGDLYLSVYELTSGTEVDKIEKKPFFNFLPNSDAFSIGTIGCNFSCLPK
jgi:pyruvate formate lyase activating enzyme